MVKVKKSNLKNPMAKIRNLAKKAGVTLSTRSEADSYSFDGSSIALIKNEIISKSYRTYSNIIHDICHFIVAPKYRKQLPEFGLGPSPDNTRLRPRKVVSHKVAQKEEELASCLGIYYERKFKLKWARTYRLHNWGGATLSWKGTSDLFKKTIKKLIKKGFIR